MARVIALVDHLAKWVEERGKTNRREDQSRGDYAFSLRLKAEDLWPGEILNQVNYVGAAAGAQHGLRPGLQVPIVLSSKI